MNSIYLWISYMQAKRLLGIPWEIIHNITEILHLYAHRLFPTRQAFISINFLLIKVTIKCNRRIPPGDSSGDNWLKMALRSAYIREHQSIKPTGLTSSNRQKWKVSYCCNHYIMGFNWIGNLFKWMAHLVV